VAKRNTGRRGRSRKRRPGSQPTISAAGSGEARRQRSSPPKALAKPAYRDPTSSGERPQAPWHPLPLSELLILVGAIGTIVGFRRTERGVLLAGIGAVALGTVEVTYREHMSGYRSHTILLAMIPTLVVFVGLSLLGAALATPVPTWLRVVPIVIVVPLFAGLFKLLRARFLDARRERTSAARR
jgi:hypothetical protein